MTLSLLRQIHLADNLEALPRLPSAFASLIYVDPPFNTGKVQRRARIKATRSTGDGDRQGFAGNRYDIEKVESGEYADDFEDFEAFLLPRIELSLRCLTDDGSLFVHLDAREVHYIKVALDRMIGRDHFVNEIIWAYDYGGRPKNRWPPKHDTILWYARDPQKYIFDFAAIDRIPYMAPGLVGKEKAKVGKTPTDVWWHTIVPTNGRGKNRVSDAKTARRAQSSGARALATGRHGARFLCRQRDDGRSGDAERSRLRADRSQSRSRRDHGQSIAGGFAGAARFFG